MPMLTIDKQHFVLFHDGELLESLKRQTTLFDSVKGRVVFELCLSHVREKKKTLGGTHESRNDCVLLGACRSSESY